MMRGSTALWLVLLAVLVAGVFQLKYTVQSLEHGLTAAREEARREREAVRVLRAEWSYLNRPRRLRVLSRRLRLEPITPSQNMGFADLPRRFAGAYAPAGALAARPERSKKTVQGHQTKRLRRRQQ